MLCQDVDLERERRVQIHREVEHDRLKARLAAARSVNDAGLEEAVSLKSLVTHSAAVVVSLLRQGFSSRGSSYGHTRRGGHRQESLSLLCFWALIT